MSWKTVERNNEGRATYKKQAGGTYGRIWEYPGYYWWAVYVGDGANEVASGKSTSLMLAKVAANAEILAVANAVANDE